MKTKNDDLQILRKLMFRLLPIQVLLAASGAVNGIVSSYFASNHVGLKAMGAVGLYGPVSMFLGAVAALIAGGCAILCGRYLGANDSKRLQEVFSLDLVLSLGISALFTAVLVILPLFHLTGIFTADGELRPLFDRYLLGQAIGIVPFFLSNQFPTFLTMENKGKMTIIASVIYIIVNLALNFLFVGRLHMEEFGLALASSVGMWIFMAVEAFHFFTKKASLKIRFTGIPWKECFHVLKIGFPGAASYIYQTLRGLIVNRLLETYAGAAGLSAFAIANNIMSIFWALPTGMNNVSRLMFSVAAGEEDRQSLTDVMRVMFRYFIPLMCAVILCIVTAAPLLTSFFVRDVTSAVYPMTLSGLRILPLCMPFSIVLMHFNSYGQVSERPVFVNIASLLDGVVFVAGFSALLVPFLKNDGVYIANVLNGVGTTLYILLYAWAAKRRFPKDLEELMVIPKGFGVEKDERIDISVKSLQEVVEVSRRVQSFCLEKGIDRKRAYLAGLSMEEMAGNIVEHGFTKDDKDHSIDIRVVHKNDKIILRIKDDCIPFDPKERNRIGADDDPAKNIGIRMVYKIARQINYQNMLRLNVLTVTI
ncbi:MAG: ATP-binding protein [Erysipelotrichaceae bacterium]|nr:ATP-binding protein [Erysipelotrichaceae bacterium]